MVFTYLHTWKHLWPLLSLLLGEDMAYMRFYPLGLGTCQQDTAYTSAVLHCSTYQHCRQLYNNTNSKNISDLYVWKFNMFTHNVPMHVGQWHRDKTIRSTQRAQTCLVEADHNPHIAQGEKYALMNVGPWWKANLKGCGLLPAPWSGHATIIMSFFCSFTYLRRFGLPPKFNHFFLVLPRTPA